MPFCKKCGKKLDDDAAFCPKCGTPADKEETIIPEPDNDIYQTQIRDSKASYGILNLEKLPKGHIIDERYEIKEKLGQGGFGTVYLAYDLVMGIDKALKIIPEAVSSDKEAMFDLQKEARTMIALNHPNIVRVYDFHNSGNIKYIDMEYVDGKTLSEIKMEYPDKRVPEDRVKELAIKISEGMAYAHDNKVLHKDIKPQNIKVNSKGEIKIMDFGIAETVRTSMSRLQNSSSSGTLVYMSPEQIRGKDVGKESDIYSYGAMLYELLCGHPPFYKGDISYQILNEKPDEIDNISLQLSAIVKKSLTKDYTKRFRKFEDVIGILKSESDLSDGQIIIQKEKEDYPENKKVSNIPEISRIEMVNVAGDFTTKNKKKKHISVSFIIFLLIVICIATAISIQMFNTHAMNSDRWRLVGNLQTLGAQVMQYYRTPCSQGGGGYRIEKGDTATIATFIGWEATYDTWDSGTFTLTIPAYNTVRIVGKGTRIGNDGTSNVHATLTVTCYASSPLKTVIEN